MKRSAFIIISLFSGVFIYLGFRSTHTPIYHWAVKLGFGNELSILRRSFQQIHLKDWMIYSLPDGLWMFSFVLSILSIWNFYLDKTNRIWIFSAIIIGLGFEFLQGFVKGMGVFDYTDLMLMILGTMLALTFIKTKRGNEKSYVDHKSINKHQEIYSNYLIHE